MEKFFGTQFNICVVTLVLQRSFFMVTIYAMDKKSKILLSFVALLIVAVVGIEFNRIVVKKDYQIIDWVDCDPTVNSCFVSADEETGEITNYAVISKKASTIFACDPKTQTCDELMCEEGEQECEVSFCTPADAEAGESCSK